MDKLITIGNTIEVLYSSLCACVPMCVCEFVDVGNEIFCRSICVTGQWSTAIRTTTRNKIYFFASFAMHNVKKVKSVVISNLNIFVLCIIPL